MKLRLLALTFSAALLLAFAATAVACGDDSLTLEEYFQQLEALTATAEERGAEFQDAFDAQVDAVASEEEWLAVLEDAFTKSQLIFTTFADGLTELNPPAVVEELHNEFVDVSAELLASLEEVLNELDLDSVANLFDGLLEESGANQAGERFDKTCAALQDIADENEIDVDLDCED